MRNRKISLEITPSNANFLALFIFTIYILFSNDDSGIRCKLRYASETRMINERINIISEQMKRDSIILYRIRVSDDYLEQVARESLFMTRESEIIFKMK